MRVSPGAAFSTSDGPFGLCMARAAPPSESERLLPTWRPATPPAWRGFGGLGSSSPPPPVPVLQSVPDRTSRPSAVATGRTAAGTKGMQEMLRRGGGKLGGA
jgi:hypothetical protein